MIVKTPEADRREKAEERATRDEHPSRAIRTWRPLEQAPGELYRRVLGGEGNSPRSPRAKPLRSIIKLECHYSSGQQPNSVKYEDGPFRSFQQNQEENGLC